MYAFWGKVKKGNQRGRALGFPTANIALHKTIPEGIYISKTKIRQQTYPSLTFIGAAKTFAQTEILAETYILDFNQALYEQWVSVRLIKKIRDNQKFTGAKELITQMKQDEKAARTYFGMPGDA